MYKNHALLLFEIGSTLLYMLCTMEAYPETMRVLAGIYPVGDFELTLACTMHENKFSSTDTNFSWSWALRDNEADYEAK